MAKMFARRGWQFCRTSGLALSHNAYPRKAEYPLSIVKENLMSMTLFKALILDWAGTTIDHGSLAPVRTIQSVFGDQGIVVSEAHSRDNAMDVAACEGACEML